VCSCFYTAVMSKLEERTELLAELNHPNLIKYYKGWADVKNRRFIFITEISTSGSLQRFLRRKVHMKANVMRSWTSQILDGLHYLHCRDPALVHHALTCSSVFISGTVKIGGLELATLLDFYPPAEFHMEPGFEAPDRGDSKNSHALKAIDIYSLGMTLLQMFTNRYPYAECKTISDICQFSQRGKLPRALKKLRNLVAADFIRSCLAPAALRPTTAQLMDHTFLSTDFEQGETLTEEADDDADADANGSDSESDDDNGSLQSSTSINANKRPSTPSTAAAAVVPTLATATIAAAAASASSLAVHKEDIKAYVGDRPSRGLSPRPAGAAGNVSPRPARGDALKVYFDVSGAQASQMDCIRLSLEEVQNVRALKLRIITDLGLHHAVDRAADGTTLALDESEYRASLQSVTDSVDELARIGETVSKIRLKYRDCEGDYVTVAERTPIAEIARHAKSLHVYALHHPATTTTVAAAAASSTAAATTTTSTNEASLS
jgi:hypothetical protein